MAILYLHFIVRKRIFVEFFNHSKLLSVREFSVKFLLWILPFFVTSIVILMLQTDHNFLFLNNLDSPLIYILILYGNLFYSILIFNMFLYFVILIFYFLIPFISLYIRSFNSILKNKLRSLNIEYLIIIPNEFKDYNKNVISNSEIKNYLLYIFNLTFIVSSIILLLTLPLPLSSPRIQLIELNSNITVLLSLSLAFLLFISLILFIIYTPIFYLQNLPFYTPDNHKIRYFEYKHNWYPFIVFILIVYIEFFGYTAIEFLSSLFLIIFYIITFFYASLISSRIFINRNFKKIVENIESIEDLERIPLVLNIESILDLNHDLNSKISQSEDSVIFLTTNSSKSYNLNLQVKYFSELLNEENQFSKEINKQFSDNFMIKSNAHYVLGSDIVHFDFILKNNNGKLIVIELRNFIKSEDEIRIKSQYYLKMEHTLDFVVWVEIGDLFKTFIFFRNGFNSFEAADLNSLISQLKEFLV